MKVLVTGSEGYIGTVLVPMLRAAGHSVTRLDSLLFQESAFTKIDGAHEVVKVDIRDVTRAHLSGHDAVIHLAALSNDPLSDLAPTLTMQINHAAAANIAATARAAGVRRFIFSSTCAVYGFQGDNIITEDSLPDPLTPYAVSKQEAERAISKLASESFQVVHLRHGTAYGLSPMMRFDLVLNNFVAWAHTSGRILLKSDGMAWRPLVHVEDICSAFIATLEAPTQSVAGEVFNIGRTEDNVRIKDLASMVVHAVPGCQIEYADGASADKRSYRVDFSKAERTLPGFRPVWNLENGIRQVVKGVASSNIEGLQFEEHRYSRINHLKHRLAVGTLDHLLHVRGPGMPEKLWERTCRCRACGQPRLVSVVSFGDMPLADKLRRMPHSVDPAPKAPLELLYCQGCSLTQLSISISPSFLFDAEYPYYSSVSPTLSRHFKESAQRIISVYGVGRGATVIEAGSNDGYMLCHFKQAGATVLGFDPAEGPASTAMKRGVDTRISFFGVDAAQELKASNIRADIFLANNVLAHVPDLVGFVESLASVLKPAGTAVIEVPYLVDLVTKREFDTIYHQHLCYFTMTSLEHLFSAAGLRIISAERIPIHGGSLRLFVGRGAGSGDAAARLIEEEQRQGWHEFEFVQRIGSAAESVRRDLTDLIAAVRQEKQTLCGYGAAAKATTLLAWCGLDTEQLEYVADLNVFKHGLYIAGTDLEVVAADRIRQTQPGMVLILAWNFADEIMDQLAAYRNAGGRFIIPLPEPQVV
jgi:nucleoside-diphosphate-sugar epimerase/SAM-dependent methyltransferase